MNHVQVDQAFVCDCSINLHGHSRAAGSPQVQRHRPGRQASPPGFEGTADSGLLP